MRIHLFRLEGGQIEVRVKGSEACLRPASTITREGGVPTNGALPLTKRVALVVLLKVIVHELEGPDEHRRVGTLTAGVLHPFDPALVRATRHGLVAGGLRFGEVDDFGQLAVVLRLVFVSRSCVEFRALRLRYLGGLSPCWRSRRVAALLC